MACFRRVWFALCRNYFDSLHIILLTTKWSGGVSSWYYMKLTGLYYIYLFYSYRGIREMIIMYFWIIAVFFQSYHYCHFFIEEKAKAFHCNTNSWSVNFFRPFYATRWMSFLVFTFNGILMHEKKVPTSYVVISELPYDHKEEKERKATVAMVVVSGNLWDLRSDIINLLELCHYPNWRKYKRVEQ